MKLGNSKNVQLVKFKKFVIWKIPKCMIVFQIEHFWNFDNFSSGQTLNLLNFENLPSFKIVKFGKLAYFPNWKFLEFSNLGIYEISRISQFWKFTNFQNFLYFGKLSKFRKLTNFWIFRLFNIRRNSQFCLFSYLPFNINIFWRFIFSIFIFYFSDS